MAGIDTQRLREQLSRTIGPAPWYWQTFPSITSTTHQRFIWSHHGEQGPLAYVVSLGLQQEQDKQRLALNTYCRPFLVPPAYLGIWCPEGRGVRITCFDLDGLKAFDLAEIAGWFKQSGERIYAATEPVADIDLPLTLSAGRHAIKVPEPLRSVDELIVPTSYPATTNDDPAFALYVVHPAKQVVDVFPQRWFTTAQYQVGKRWIPRAARDPESQLLFGECYGVGSFLLEEDGCRLQRWLERTS